MRRSTAIVLGVSGVALAVTASSAFTASGLTITNTSQFIGGKASQTITGATLASVVYGLDSTSAELNSIELTFSSATPDTSTVAVTVTGTGSGGWTCENIGATTPHVSTCTPTTSGNTYSAVSSVSVTVA